LSNFSALVQLPVKTYQRDGNYCILNFTAVNYLLDFAIYLQPILFNNLVVHSIPLCALYSIKRTFCSSGYGQPHSAHQLHLRR